MLLTQLVWGEPYVTGDSAPVLASGVMLCPCDPVCGPPLCGNSNTVCNTDPVYGPPRGGRESQRGGRGERV